MHDPRLGLITVILLPLGCSVGHRPQVITSPRTRQQTTNLATTTRPLPTAAVSINEPRIDADGVTHYTIQSACQRGRTTLRLVAPPGGTSRPEQRFLFVLPVEPGEQTQYGDGLAEVLRQRLHIKHHLIVVAPSFSDWPWYADHPTDPTIRQESYLRKVIIPLVDQLYPTTHPRRLLLGFSKSGWGAMTLLLRQPDSFAAACAWDAPLMMDRPGRYESGTIFQTLENFEKYRISRLLQENASALRVGKRIALAGYCNFGDDMRQTHQLLNRLRIPHAYIDRSRDQHVWESGWVEEAVDLLVKMVDSK